MFIASTQIQLYCKLAVHLHAGSIKNFHTRLSVHHSPLLLDCNHTCKCVLWMGIHALEESDLDLEQKVA